MPVSRNHGRWAGAFAWVRNQILNLPASALSSSMASRALRPVDGAGDGLASVDMGFLQDTSSHTERSISTSPPGGGEERRLPAQLGRQKQTPLCADLAEIQQVLW